ncbi:hypothetical protein U879_02295 [Defluviimonas sp. 20V17]|uniref:Catechol 2,3-dioxygenase n=1 Tax=Allgaiera indica TaxID=765699 RepID=A0AAN5A0P3_9RHOB|nr:VOC family protein [Allgaiera indica]KDB05326.1 hypothetical protein U879_02295 [Defluviimonas sp. 20V17]GHE04855.1 lactoylglutathione lyase [Allgaiera indica]SDX52394.1 Catechol 2,3-dioxygenase [Allgaiera indica]
MQATAILETVLYATDLEAAEAFYTRVFGLQVVRRLAGKFVFFRCGAGMLLIFDPVQSAAVDPANPIPRHGAVGAGHLCFATGPGQTIEAWRAHFAAQGVAIETLHVWPGGARSLYLRDPAGNSIEIGEPKMWGLD